MEKINQKLKPRENAVNFYQQANKKKLEQKQKKKK